MMDPKIIAQLIFSDIAGRRGVGDEIDQVDDDVKAEMLETWAEIIRKGCNPEAK
jgi:hypothetical protein